MRFKNSVGTNDFSKESVSTDFRMQQNVYQSHLQLLKPNMATAKAMEYNKDG